MWEAKGSRHKANSQLLPNRCCDNYYTFLNSLAVTKSQEESPYKSEALVSATTSLRICFYLQVGTQIERAPISQGSFMQIWCNSFDHYQ